MHKRLAMSVYDVQELVALVRPVPGLACSCSESLAKLLQLLLVLCTIVGVILVTEGDCQVLDESWTLTVNGRSVRPNPDGSFRIPNLSAGDRFGAGGPGTRPDFLSDDFLRLVGSRTIEGRTEYVFSEPFQIRQGETFTIGNLTYTTIAPPLPESLVITADTSLLMVGSAAQLVTTGLLGDGSRPDLSARVAWTVYRTSNAAIASVDEDGLVSGNGKGVAFITAVNDGAAAVYRMRVEEELVTTSVEGRTQLLDGTPVVDANVTLFGQSVPSLAPDGIFSFTDIEVPSGESVTAVATADVGGTGLLGVGRGVVVADGVTDVGILVLEDVGYALDLDGSGAYLEIPTTLRGFGVTNAFTISVWIKADDVSGMHMLLEDGTQFNTSSFYLGVSPRQRRVFARLNTTRTSYFNDSISLPPFAERWANLTYTYDGAAIRLYLDGALFFSRGVSGNIVAGNRNLRVGFPSGERFFVGRVDELSIWTLALSEDQVRSMLAQDLSGTEAGLAGFWSFDEGQGEVSADRSVNGNDASLAGGAAWALDNPRLRQ